MLTATPVAAYGIGSLEAPPLAGDAGSGDRGVVSHPAFIPASFWQTSSFGLILLILLVIYFDGRLLKR